jgi:hypothetical protein
METMTIATCWVYGGVMSCYTLDLAFTHIASDLDLLLVGFSSTFTANC